MNKNIKKIFSIFLIITFIFSLSACTKKEETDNLKEVINKENIQSEEEIKLSKEKEIEDFNKLLALDGLFIKTITANQENGIIEIFKKNIPIYDNYAKENSYIEERLNYSSKQYKKENDFSKNKIFYTVNEKYITSSFELECKSNENTSDLIKNTFENIKLLYGIDFEKEYQKIIEVYTNNDEGEFSENYKLSNLNYTITYSKYLNVNNEKINNLSFSFTYLPKNEYKNELKEMAKIISDSLSKQSIELREESLNNYIDNYKNLASFYDFNIMKNTKEDNKDIYTFYYKEPIEEIDDTVDFNKSISFNIKENEISSEIFYSLSDLSENDIDLFLEQCNVIYDLNLNNYKKYILDLKNINENKYYVENINSKYTKSRLMFNRYKLNEQVIYSIYLEIKNVEN